MQKHNFNGIKLAATVVTAGTLFGASACSR